MAKKDYFMPLYYQRLLTSTIGWKDEEFGAFLKLLIYQFDRGSIPSDLNAISRIAPSARKCWPLLSQKFVADSEGNLKNEVMDQIRKSREVRSQINSRNGEMGASKRWQNDGKRHSETDGESDSETDTKKIAYHMVDGVMVNSGTLTNNRVSNRSRKDFLKDQKWKEEFCMAKHLKMQELEQLQEEWLQNVDLKGTEIRNYKSYFLVYYDEAQPKISKKSHWKPRPQDEY